MTDQELQDWVSREARRRLATEANYASEPLPPAVKFSDSYAPEDPEVPGTRGPQSSTIRGLLAGSCAGWKRRPDSAELYEAMRSNAPTGRQMAVAAVLIGEATIDEILMAYLEGAFTWRQLARMMHRLEIQSNGITRYLNNWTIDKNAWTASGGTGRKTSTG